MFNVRVGVIWQETAIVIINVRNVIPYMNQGTVNEVRLKMIPKS